MWIHHVMILHQLVLKILESLEAQQEGTNAMNVVRNHPAEPLYSLWEFKRTRIHHMMIKHQLVLKMVESLEAQEITQCIEKSEEPSSKT